MIEIPFLKEEGIFFCFRGSGFIDKILWFINSIFNTKNIQLLCFFLNLT